MSLILNTLHEALNPSTWITRLYDTVSSVGSHAQSHPVITVGITSLVVINMTAFVAGRSIARWSRNTLTLNNLTPISVRQLARAFGHIVGLCTTTLERLIPSSIYRDFFSTVVIAPAVEEMIFRLPILLVASNIDSSSATFIHMPLASGIIDITGGHLLKALAASVSSIGFTYAHQDNPSPGRAAGTYVTGLALSTIVLHPEGGLEYAIVAHSLHNLIARTLGLQIDVGIFP